MKKFFAVFLAFSALNLSVFADEGMWMTNTLDKKKSALCGAIVSYDFMGTGSLVSPDGLVVTNHHVVYGDVYAMSSEEHNYLRDGFWAATNADEMPIPGRSAQILCATIDVTDRVNAMIASGEVKEGPMMMRKLGSMLEAEYEKTSGKTAILSSMWRGSRYYIYLYDNYRDIRLVAAPPESIGAFGGDEDNWEWPQQKGDFSFVRIYTAPDGSPAEYSENNVPLKSPQHLIVSSKGVKEGGKTMVLGFPGRTNRYSGSATVDFQTNVSLPVTVKVRGAQMEILRRWMNEDETVRLKYADHFFGLSNAQELYEGQIACNRRFDVVGEKKAVEKELQAWIDASAERKAKWGNLLERMDSAYAAVGDLERQLRYFSECIFRASKLSPIATRTAGLCRGCSEERSRNTQNSSRKDYASMDLRVEKDIFRYCLEQYMENVDSTLLGDYQKELRIHFGKDYDAMCNWIWEGSWMTSPHAIAEYLDPCNNLNDVVQSLSNDPLCRFFNDNKMARFNAEREKILGSTSISNLVTEYTHALYQMRLDKKIRQYPDANSTLRISYGKVCGFSPRDAIICNWRSTVRGLLDKHNPDNHDFCLPQAWKNALESANPDMTVNFITDNDITGGNSGSPVLDAAGRVVGLAFDGNKESLASDVSFTPDYNRCICVDIRFVLWTLQNYAGMGRLLDEMKIK